VIGGGSFDFFLLFCFLRPEFIFSSILQPSSCLHCAKLSFPVRSRVEQSGVNPATRTAQLWWHVFDLGPTRLATPSRDQPCAQVSFSPGASFAVSRELISRIIFSWTESLLLFDFFCASFLTDFFCASFLTGSRSFLCFFMLPAPNRLAPVGVRAWFAQFLQ
jgi:hypothetical protein